MARRNSSKEEKIWLNRVAGLGCIICGQDAEIHHIGNGTLGKRADNYSVIPLCHAHHRTGGHGVAVHAGRRTWEAIHGTEKELLEQVRQMIREQEISEWGDMTNAV